MGSIAQIWDIGEIAKFIGMGYYRVKENGKFLEADEKARTLFGIPQTEEDLSKHSIINCYIFPEERKPRLEKLKRNGGKPISSTLSVRVNGEDLLLFDQCWYENNDGEKMIITGLVSNIEDRIISAKTFEDFPLGVYQLDDNNNIVHFNKKAMEIFGYIEEQKSNLLNRNIGDFYINKEDLKNYSDQVSDKGHAHGILKFRSAKQKIIELECFTENINEFKKARWGMINDVTKRERYFRALDRLPTGYYYIEYDQNKEFSHQGKIIQCNEQFANILGVESVDDLIGKNVEDYYARDEDKENFFKRLENSDKEGEHLLNFPFKLRRVDNNEIIDVEVDVHLVKENGKVIGREGTVRDISEKVELESKVRDTEKRLHTMTTDIDNLIHTFLHPVLKIAVHSELFHQMGGILSKTVLLKRHEKEGIQSIEKVGQELEKRLIVLRKKLSDISSISTIASALIFKLDKIIFFFDYNRDKMEKTKILIDKKIRDTALWVLEELDEAGFFNGSKQNDQVHKIITVEFIEFLQSILFDYLIRTAKILNLETLVMRQEIETLRGYIRIGRKRISHLKSVNLAKILEKNIETFMPVLAQKDIQIEYRASGPLNALMSENDIDRVICNLLHNAAKYSYSGPGRIIRIKTRELHLEKAVEFSISNYGIPIKQEEIVNGSIFNFGYRGQMAYKADRDGTGVGLADAKDVIDQHNGSLHLSSMPVKDDGNPPKYKVPYITTITVKLPKTKKKEK